jgi:hypothetical protein
MDVGGSNHGFFLEKLRKKTETCQDCLASEATCLVTGIIFLQKWMKINLMNTCYSVQRFLLTYLLTYVRS